MQDRGPRQPEELPAVVDAIRRKYRPERIILFGSFAWGTPGPDSDVDLLIVKDTDAPPLDRGYEVRKAIQGSKHGLPMDVVVLTPQELEARLRAGDSFVRDIVHRGVVLYAA
jgi:uncharacterized protein